MSNWSFSYTDGSGNQFRFWKQNDKTHFQYDPVQPRFSSSGIYSGGTEKKGVLSTEQAIILEQRIGFWRANKSEHVETRMMGVGLLSIKEDEITTSFLLPEGKLKQLSEMLRPLRR